MQIRTAQVLLDAPADEVFQWLSHVENHGLWATEFIREMRAESATRARALTAKGEMYYAIEPDPGTGVIDIRVGPSEDRTALFPTRVVSLPGDRSAFLFTVVQGPEQPDTEFESDFASLERELENLRERFAPATADAAPGGAGDGGGSDGRAGAHDRAGPE